MMVRPKFHYQLDRHSFFLPWTKPDLHRLKLWYCDLLDTVKDLGPYRVQLFGGGWSTPPDHSWDLDLFLVPDMGAVDVTDIENLRLAHRIILTGYRLALNEHRFLIDFTLGESSIYLLVFQAYKKFESDPDYCVRNPPNGTTGYSIFKRYRKYLGNACEFDDEIVYVRKVNLGRGRYFYEKPVKILRKQMAHIRNGRTYHQPVYLDELFD